MILALTVLLVICVGLLGALLAYRSHHPADRLLTRSLRDRYVVTVQAGETFSGLLMDVDAHTLVLADIQVLKSDGTSTSVDGTIVLRRESVCYMQRPPS